jgi:hypothetical protein
MYFDIQCGRGRFINNNNNEYKEKERMKKTEQVIHIKKERGRKREEGRER